MLLLLPKYDSHAGSPCPTVYAREFAQTLVNPNQLRVTLNK
jgi:hypothetical protein